MKMTEEVLFKRCFCRRRGGEQVAPGEFGIGPLLQVICVSVDSKFFFLFSLKN